MRDRVDVDAPPPPSPPAEAFGGSILTENVPAWESHHNMKTTSSGTWPNHLHFFMADEGFRDVPMPVLSLQTEFFVPLDRLDEALAKVAAVSQQWPGWSTWDGSNPATQGPTHICEVRTVAEDDIWLSPCYGQESASIHFTLGWYPEIAWSLVQELEQVLSSFGARPHWGKLWTECPIDLYPRANDFKEVRERLDPTGKFCSEFTRRALGL